MGNACSTSCGTTIRCPCSSRIKRRRQTSCMSCNLAWEQLTCSSLATTSEAPTDACIASGCIAQVVAIWAATNVRLQELMRASCTVQAVRKEQYMNAVVDVFTEMNRSFAQGLGVYTEHVCT